MNLKSIVILYHADCSDGFGAAWVLWKKFGNKASYIPVYNQAPPPKGLIGKEIYTVDFTYPKKPLGELVRNNKRVTVIDHHISSRREALSSHRPLFDNNHSGSVLAWQYFNSGKKVPKLLRYIEDMDLWKFRFAKTWNIIKCLEMIPNDFRAWSTFVKKVETKKGEKECIEKGEALLADEEKKIQKGVAYATHVLFEGYRTYAANTPFFHSQIGHELYEKFPPIAIVWSERDGEINVSLRSNGKVDVSKLAKKYGGGGHKGASGFKLKRGAKLPWRVLTNNKKNGK